MNDSTEKSQRSKSWGPADVKVLRRHPGRIFQVWARAAFQVEESSQSLLELSRAEANRTVLSPCVFVSVSVCVAASAICCAATPAGPGTQWTVSGIEGFHRWRARPPAAAHAYVDPKNTQVKQWTCEHGATRVFLLMCKKKQNMGEIRAVILQRWHCLQHVWSRHKVFFSSDNFGLYHPSTLTSNVYQRFWEISKWSKQSSNLKD